MEIIASAKERKNSVVCGHCKDLIGYFDEEVSERLRGTHYTMYGYERHVEEYIVCPHCGIPIVLREKSSHVSLSNTELR